MMNLTQHESHSESAALVARIVRNSLFVFLARALETLIRIVLVAITARYLGVELFGEFAFIMAIAALLIPILDFGVERIIVREISIDIANADKYVSSALILRMVFSIVLILAIITVTHMLHWDQRMALALFVATCSQIFLAFGIVFLGVFRSFERMEYDILLSFFHQLIKLTSIVVVVAYDLGLLSIFLAMALADLSKTVLQAITVSLKFFRPRLILNLNYCKLLLKEAYPIAIFAFLAMMSFKVDVFILKYFRGPVEISLFEIPHRIIMQIQILSMSIVIALFPLLSRLAKSSRSSLEYAYEKVFKVLLNLSLPITILIIIWAKEIIIAVFGKEYLDASLALQILVGTLSSLFLTSLMNFTLISIGKQTLTIVSIVICFCVNLLLDLLLVPKYGYLGASVGTLAAYLCFFCTALYFTSKNVCNIPIISIAYKTIVCGIIMILGCITFKSGNLLGLALGIISGIFCYILTMIALKTFTREEVNLLKMAIINRA